MGVLINMFLIIIEDTYMDVKAQGKYEWLEDDQTDQSNEEDSSSDSDKPVKEEKTLKALKTIIQKDQEKWEDQKKT